MIEHSREFLDSLANFILEQYTVNDNMVKKVQNFVGKELLVLVVMDCHQVLFFQKNCEGRNISE